MAENLFCTEEASNLCFGDFDSEATNYQIPQTINQNLLTGGSIVHRSDPSIELPLMSDESFVLMVEREKEHLPRGDYLKRLRIGDLDLGVRREALDWISKVHAHYNFGPLSFCLSVNYLDRFLSRYELPRGKTWAIQLSALACLSLATKVGESKFPQAVDMQIGEPKFVFEGKTIKRMELVVLNTLNWRMQVCTPCSFIDFFLNKINNGGGGGGGDHQLPIESLISRSVQLILSTIKGIDFLEFKPSEVAAAVAMCLSGERQAISFDKAMPLFIYVDKVRVEKCVELIQDLSLISVSSSSGANANPNPNGSNNVGGTLIGRVVVPQSPIGVLDAACLSYKSDDLTTTTVGSCPNSSSHTNTTKRRRLVLDDDNNTPSNVDSKT